MKELPAGWAWTKIREIAKTSSGGTPSRGESAFFWGDIPWVKSGELPDGPLSGETEEYLTRAGLDSCTAKVLDPETILVAMYGATTGRLGVVTSAVSTNQAICAIEVQKGIDPRFLFYFLLHLRPHLLSSRSGGAQPNLNQEFLANLRFPVAPSAEQHRIVAEIEKQFSRVDAAVALLLRVEANLNGAGAA